MKKRRFAVLATILATSVVFSSCAVLHKHTLGAWQYDDAIGHFKECSCGYKIAENPSKHIDEDRDDACDMCGYSMKYEVNSLCDLSWYLSYYYEQSEYEYFNKTNMKPHNIRDMNFKNTVTYRESKARVKFEAPEFNEYLTKLPKREEYIKSNSEYYSYYQISEYHQTNVPADYYTFCTQETVRYGLSEQNCDYVKFSETASKFKTVHEFYETASSSTSTKKIYQDSKSYNEDNLSLKNDLINTVFNDISRLIRYYLNVEFTDYGGIILPEDSYFNGIEIKTENDVVYFNITKNDGKTFWKENIKYDIDGRINLKTHELFYNLKESYNIDGEIIFYEDYDYDLILTNEPIDIEFDTDGEFEEIYIEMP